MGRARTTLAFWPEARAQLTTVRWNDPLTRLDEIAHCTSSCEAKKFCLFLMPFCKKWDEWLMGRSVGFHFERIKSQYIWHMEENLSYYSVQFLKKSYLAKLRDDEVVGFVHNKYTGQTRCASAQNSAVMRLERAKKHVLKAHDTIKVCFLIRIHY